MKKIIVIPVARGESDYLKITLPYYNRIHDIKKLYSVEEDARVEKVILERYSENSTIITHKSRNWSNPCADNFHYTITYAFQQLGADVVYAFACDLIPDERVFFRDYWNKYDIVSFRYWNNSIKVGVLFKLREQYDNILKKILTKFGRTEHHTGVYALKKRVWEKVQLRDVPSEYDDFLRRCINAGFKHHHELDSRIIHLRAGYGITRQYLQGFARRQLGYPLWKVLGHAVIHLKPYVLKGYLIDKDGYYFHKLVWKKQ